MHFLLKTVKIAYKKNIFHVDNMWIVLPLLLIQVCINVHFSL